MTNETSSNPPARPSLVVWAIVALILVVFSYLFTLLLGVLSIYLPYRLVLLWPRLNTVVLLLAGACVSFVIFWSLLPRRDRFAQPGPLLDPCRQPRLFTELAGIAAALQEPLPSEVYLVPEMNAWVAERGGILGFGSHRVMGLGLPLIRILTIPEFRAVLAHEFGHFYGGDTRLWPWVHKTRAAMARTLENLSSDALSDMLTGAAGLMHQLAVTGLEAYWKVFMKITQAISRRHEYRADELASYVAGPQALIDGLRTIHKADVALPVFWQTEMIPAVQAGYRPSFADGFASFIKVPAIATQIDQHIETRLRESEISAYDTHPPLMKRIAALRQRARTEDKADQTPAISLVDSVDELELELLQMLMPELKVADLRSVSWDRIGSEAYLPAWRVLARASGSMLADYTIEQLPEFITNIKQFAASIPDPQGRLLTREQRAERAAQILWRVLAIALCEHGWSLHASPGEFYLERDGHRVAPGDIVTQIRSGAMTPEEWTDRCNSLGIAGIRLNPVE